jgi:dTDP-4-amino-4,6-dideoxygalactose transaminase
MAGSPMEIIPFNRPYLTGKEAQYVAEALASGHLCGDGPFTKRASQWLEGELGAPRVLLTTNCTHALEMCALLLELKPGDEVIVPSFAFVTTASAFSLHGAKLVFADVRADTLNLDERLLESLITPRTKAIVALHYGGVACDMDAIQALARPRKIAVLEDNAHGLFASYRGRKLGTLGLLATQSFHETKNVTCGEGGALVLNDPGWIARAEIVREKGTNRARFLRGQVDKYTWVAQGSSYLPSELLAAVLCAQLEASAAIQAARMRVWYRYFSALDSWARAHGVSLPVIPPDCEHPAHVFHLLLPDLATRTAFLAHLKAAGIQAVFHYQPLHLSEVGRALGGQPGQCPVTEDVADRLARLPLHAGLSSADVERVLAAVTSFAG